MFGRARRVWSRPRSARSTAWTRRPRSRRRRARWARPRWPAGARPADFETKISSPSILSCISFQSEASKVRNSASMSCGLTVGHAFFNLGGAASAAKRTAASRGGKTGSATMNSRPACSAARTPSSEAMAPPRAPARALDARERDADLFGIGGVDVARKDRPRSAASALAAATTRSGERSAAQCARRRQRLMVVLVGRLDRERALVDLARRARRP